MDRERIQHAVVILAVLLASQLNVGCHVPVVDRGRNIINGVPQLGVTDCCPTEAHPAAGCHFGKCDREQYGPRPVACRESCCNKVTPWRTGVDCNGRWAVLERLVGRRRIAHSLPFPQLDCHGCAGFHYTYPRTIADDERVLQQAFLFFSVNRSTNIDGLRTKDDDILATNGSEIVRCFDGSDVGMSRLQIDGFAFLSPNQLLISVTQSFTVDADHALPGLYGTIDDSDVLLFEATRLGEVTRGQFSVYLDGSDVGLDTDDEDIDALSINQDGLIVSTTGDFDAQDVSGKDEDLVQLTSGQYGPESSGAWKMLFDGSKNKMSTASTEDIDGVSAAYSDTLFLTTRGKVDVDRTVGLGHDILRVPFVNGRPSISKSSVLIHGDHLQLKPDSISAIALPPWQLPYRIVSTTAPSAASRHENGGF